MPQVFRLGLVVTHLALAATALAGENSGLRWDARAVEHLYNRAGFGATSAEIEQAVHLRPEAVVESLLTARGAWIDVEPILFRWEDFGLDHKQVTLATSEYYKLSTDAQVDMCKESRVVDRNQFLDLNARWFRSMIEGRDPLCDKMTLFWHGYFTTSWEVVKRKYELVNQFQWMRRNSLGGFAELLHGIVRDPAMLQYLDNTTNVRGHPNENLARELMELFTLGEGHYTEHDVREAARALTGNAGGSDGRFEFLAADHDTGTKTILGVTGNLGDRELVDILLSREECPRWVARRLVRFFEGVEPSAARIERYARVLRENGYAIRPVLRALFLDPEFYRDDVREMRVLGPIEFLAQVGHKLDIVPNGHFLNRAGAVLGQSFYLPPTVKGWPEGLDWITNDTLIRRGNCLGVLFGVFGSAREAATAASDVSIGATNAMDGAMPSLEGRTQLGVLFETLGDARWEPSEALLDRMSGSGARTDASFVDWVLEDWLAVEPQPETRDLVRRWFAEERVMLGLDEATWWSHREERTILVRKLAHLVFSLPEAQLS
jgi:uncharacterized protein (DUF1800 family)